MSLYSYRTVLLCLVPALLMAACGSNGSVPTGGLNINNQTGGTFLGVAGGALLGSQVGGGRGKVLATAAGAIVGGLAGSAIGQRLDERDRLLAGKAERNALENGRSGQAVSWRNPDNGRSGQIIPEAPYKQGNGFCRPYSHRVFIDGRTESLRGTACRNADGTWRNTA